jgi:hypothetical protein
MSKDAKVTKLQAFHAGGVIGLITSPVAHIAMTAGQDGRWVCHVKRNCNDAVVTFVL